MTDLYLAGGGKEFTAAARQAHSNDAGNSCQVFSHRAWVKASSNVVIWTK